MEILYDTLLHILKTLSQQMKSSKLSKPDKSPCFQRYNALAWEQQYKHTKNCDGGHLRFSHILQRSTTILLILFGMLLHCYKCHHHTSAFPKCVAFTPYKQFPHTM